MAAQTLATPKTADEAIAFALDNLPAFEVADFLKDFREGKSLDWWTTSLAEDRREAEQAETSSK